MTQNRFTALAVASAVVLTACATDAPDVTDVTDVSAKQAKVEASGSVTTVMRGLNAPRGLAFGPEGALSVAEAGTATVTSYCVSLPRFRTCFSGTGSISRLFTGEQTRIVSGLPSGFDGEIGGPSHIDFQGRGNGFVTIGLGTPPDARSGLGPRGAQLGTLVRFKPNGSTLTGAPFVPGAARIFRVVEGSTPTVYVDGLTQVTDFDFGRDGSLYATQYGSFPFFNGPGSVVKVTTAGVKTTVLGGLTRPTGVIVGADGAVYVSNRGASEAVGEVLRLAP